jgi:hypothetical protein
MNWYRSVGRLMVAQLINNFPTSSGTAMFIGLFTRGGTKFVYNISLYVYFRGTCCYVTPYYQADHMIVSCDHYA